MIIDALRVERERWARERWAYVGITDPRTAKQIAAEGIDFSLAELYEDQQGVLDVLLEENGLQETVRLLKMAKVVRDHDGSFEGQRLLDVAQEWMETGFFSEQVGQWIDVGCFYPNVAFEANELGISPEQFGRITDDAGYTHTLAFKVCNGDLGFTDAAKLASIRLVK